MSTYSGQNIGARKIDRIGQGVKACNIVGIIYSVLALLIIVFLGKWMLLLFVDAVRPPLSILPIGTLCAVAFL